MAERTCSVPDCGRPALARAWCSAHYERWRSTGDVQADKPVRSVRRTPRGDVFARFSFFIEQGPVPPGMDSPCWRWTGQLNPGGYGRFPVDGRSVMAHRWAYEFFVGPIPDGLTLDHLCRNPWCVQPRHAEPVTMDENTKRSPTQVTTINAAKTECHKGHPFSGSNLRIEPRGGRTCRACLAERMAQYRRRIRAQR